MMGVVYVMRCDDLVKVGFSKDVERRRYALSPKGKRSALTLEHCSMPLMKPRCVEKAAHQALMPDRVEGEWFRSSVDQAIDAVEKAALVVEEFYGAVRLPQQQEVMHWVREQNCPAPYRTLVRELCSIPPRDWPTRWKW